MSSSQYTLSVKINGDSADLDKDLSGLERSLNNLDRDGSNAGFGMATSFFGAQLAIEAVSKAIDIVMASLDGAVSRVDTLNQYPRVLEQMGASSEEANRSIERLSEGIQGLPTRLDEAAGTSQRFFTVFRDADLATESTLALNNALLASGSSGEQAANATDQYVKMLSSGKVEMDNWNTLSESMSYALGEVSEDLGYSKDNTWELYDALKSGEVTLDEFNQAMINASNETGGFAEVAKTATEGIRTSWTNVETAVTTGVANVIQSINDWANDNGYGSISEQFDSLKVIIQEVFDWIVNQTPEVMDTLAEIAGVFMEIYEAIEPLLPVIVPLILGFLGFKAVTGVLTGVVISVTKIVTALASFQTVWGLLKGLTGLTALGTAIGNLKTAAAGLGPLFASLTGPIGIVIGVIMVLVGVFTYLWNTNEGFRAAVIAIWENIKTFFTETIPQIVTTIIEWFGSLPERFTEWFTNIKTTISEWATNMWEKAVEVVTGFGQTLLEFFSNLPYNIGFALGFVIGKVIEWAANMVTKAYEVGSNFVTNVVQFIQELPGRVWQWLTDTITRVKTWVVDMAAKAREAGSRFITNAINFIQELPGRIQQWLSNTIARAGEFVSNFASKAREAGQKFKENIVRIVKQIPSQMRSIGSDIVRGVWNGIKRMKDWLWGNVKSFFKGIVDGAKSALGIHSPAKAMIPVGTFSVEGVMVGMENMFKDLRKMADEMAELMMPDLSRSGNLYTLEAVSRGGELVHKQTMETVSHRNVSLAYTGDPLEARTRNVEGRLDEMLGVLVQMLDKDTDVYIDSEKASAILGPAIESTRQRKELYENRRRGELI